MKIKYQISKVLDQPVALAHRRGQRAHSLHSKSGMKKALDICFGINERNACIKM